jgi:uncharacterized protein YgiM (DUF1202 family)
MEPEPRERVARSPLFKVARWTIPWIVLLILLWQISGMWRSFEAGQSAAAAQAAAAQAAAVASATAQANSTISTGTLLISLIDALRLHVRPSSTSDVIATEQTNSKLTILGVIKGWYRVRDTFGHAGWVTDSPQFVQPLKE